MEIVIAPVIRFASPARVSIDARATIWTDASPLVQARLSTDCYFKQADHYIEIGRRRSSWNIECIDDSRSLQNSPWYPLRH